MKKTLFLLSFIAMAFFAFKPTEELAIGSAMPKGNVAVKDVSGKQLTLNDAMKQKGLLVMFSCNTCPYVIKNQERTNAMCNYAIQNGIGVVLLNSNEANRGTDDSYEAMKTYADKQGYKWHYAVDKNNELADAFGANRTPECYLFGADGKLVYHGAIDDSPNDAASVNRIHLKEAISEFSQGKAISVKTSRSVGCSIKRKV